MDVMDIGERPRTNPGNRLRYVHRNGSYTLGMIAGVNNKLPFGNIPHGLLLVTLLVILALPTYSLAQQPTPEEQQTITQLKGELAQVESEIESAEEDNRAYSGGLIKTLITLRLEILRTNHALIQQRVHALESGAEIDIIVIGSEPDHELAANILAEIEDQRTKITEAEQEATRYSGGLVLAMSLSAVATQRNTLAMLEQRYFAAKYGLATPMPTASPEAGISSGATPAAPASNPTADCLDIEDFDSSVLDRNNTFVELAWRVNVMNSCGQPFQVSVSFSIYDSEDFELDSDNETVLVPANGTGIARGTMLVSPPSKAQRMSKQGAALSLR